MTSFVERLAGRIQLPLASCPRCRHLILAWIVQEEELTEVVWDPDDADRHRIRSMFPAEAARQGFGAGVDAWHRCPPSPGRQGPPGAAVAPRAGKSPPDADDRPTGHPGPGTEGRPDG